MRFKQREGISQVEVARKLSKSKQWVSQMMQIAKLPDDIRERLKKAGAAYSNASEVAKAKTPAAQSKLVDELESGASRAELRTKVTKKPSAKKTQRVTTRSFDVEAVEGAKVTVRVPKGRITNQEVIDALKEVVDSLG